MLLLMLAEVALLRNTDIFFLTSIRDLALGSLNSLPP